MRSMAPGPLGMVPGQMSAWRCITRSATCSAAAFNLPHAETHAVILPHAVGFTTTRRRPRPTRWRASRARSARPTAARRPLRPRGRARHRRPALAAIGMPEGGLDRAAALADRESVLESRAASTSPACARCSATRGRAAGRTDGPALLDRAQPAQHRRRDRREARLEHQHVREARHERRPRRRDGARWRARRPAWQMRSPSAPEHEHRRRVALRQRPVQPQRQVEQRARRLAVEVTRRLARARAGRRRRRNRTAAAPRARRPTAATDRARPSAIMVVRDAASPGASRPTAGPTAAPAPAAPPRARVA